MSLFDLDPASHPRKLFFAFAVAMAAALLPQTSCGPQDPAPPGEENFDEDTTLTTLTIEADETATIENNAVITVTGDAAIDGTLSASAGRITLRVEGDLTINGTIRAADTSMDDLPGDTPLGQQAVGIHIIVGDGTVTIGETAVLDSTGHIVITDDDDVLTSTPSDIFDNVEDVSDDDLATLVPLPPENEAFEDSDGGGAKSIRPLLQQGAPAGPVMISGVWPPDGAAPVPGDQPVIVFLFNGMRPLVLDGWTVNGPPAPAGAGGDQGDDPGMNASGGNGKNGLRLNIRNNGGPINIMNDVVLNLTDGGDGGSADAVCASATGGNGGESGNFRMTAAGGIDLTMGTLTINPGRGGNGGDATVLPGNPAAAGCPGGTGSDSTATGGAGANNRKRLFARGNVQGLANLTVGPLSGGDGGEADAEACDGGDGIICCDGGPGGSATATGGMGGDALLNISGLPVVTSPVNGGAGGGAFAAGGAGGDGGDCKFLDAGDGGAGGAADATGGDGGNASGGSAAIGGDGGDSISIGGDGGAGGDSGFGEPGVGGDGGTATATAAAGGSGDVTGIPSEPDATDGEPGPDGGTLAVTLYCIPLPLFVQSEPGMIDPGPKEGPVQDTDNTTQIGSLTIDFVAGQSVNYQRGINPDHIGIGNGELDILVSSMQLESTPGVIGGLRIEPLQGNGFGQSTPLMVQALDLQGQVVGTQMFTSIPDNVGVPEDPQTLDALFDVTDSVTTFRIIAPTGTFITIVRVYLLDP